MNKWLYFIVVLDGAYLRGRIIYCSHWEEVFQCSTSAKIKLSLSRSDELWWIWPFFGVDPRTLHWKITMRRRARRSTSLVKSPLYRRHAHLSHTETAMFSDDDDVTFAIYNGKVKDCGFLQMIQTRLLIEFQDIVLGITSDQHVFNSAEFALVLMMKLITLLSTR